MTLSLFGEEPTTRSRPRKSSRLQLARWVWRSLFTVDARPWYLEHGLDAGQRHLRDACHSFAQRAIDDLEWQCPPPGALAAVRWLPGWVSAGELWPGLGNVGPSYGATLGVFVRVPLARPAVLADLRCRITGPRAPVGLRATCARSPWTELAGYQLTAARAFLRQVYGAGQAAGWWMLYGAGVLVPSGCADLERILEVLEREQLVTRGAYAPEPSAVAGPTCGGASGYGRFRRESKYAEAEAFIADTPVYYAHYLWHPVAGQEARAMRLAEGGAA